MYSDEERQAIMRTAHETLASLADLPAKTNVVFIERRRLEEPEPEARKPLDTPVQALISQAVEQVRAELRETHEDVLEWCRGVLAELIAEADHGLARQAKTLRAEIGRVQTKGIEADINTLHAENVAMRSDIAALQAAVDVLAAQLLELSGDIDRSASKIVSIRGAT